MKRSIGSICRDQRGYVFVLALIAMPLMLGFSLIVIDVGRGNNLHTDLQNAVDALALAGARELNGGDDAITRAEAAIASLVNNQARFSNGGTAIIDETQVTRVYLDAIPVSDDDRIDAGWIDLHETALGQNANYVLVRSLARPMTSLFPIPVGLTTDTVNFQAEAVATYTAAACDVTPIFICNPFEGATPAFADRFATGDLYARQVTMSLNGGSATPGPGNFGFLRVGGTGGSVLGNALATNSPGACYTKENLETEPGATLGPVEQGLNVRFDIYAGSFNSMKNNYDYRPAWNMRKGAKQPNVCNDYVEQTDNLSAKAFPSGAVTETFAGGTLHSANWGAELEAYWDINHPADDVSGIPRIPSATHPSVENAWPPSRYDIYKYEIENELRGAPDEPNPIGHRAPNGDRGSPQCYTGPALDPDEAIDRRTIFAAVVNCTAAAISGQTEINVGDVEGFVSMFLTKPMISSGSTKTISVEITDVSGQQGNGSLDLFLREESTLVR